MKKRSTVGVVSLVLLAGILSIVAIGVRCYFRELASRQWLSNAEKRTQEISRIEIEEGPRRGTNFGDAESMRFIKASLTKFDIEKARARRPRGSRSYEVSILLADGQRLACIATIQNNGILFWKDDSILFSDRIWIYASVDEQAPINLQKTCDYLSGKD